MYGYIITLSMSDNVMTSSDYFGSKYEAILLFEIYSANAVLVLGNVYVLFTSFVTRQL